MLCLRINSPSVCVLSLALLSFWGFFVSAIKLSEVQLQRDSNPKNSFDYTIHQSDRKIFLSYWAAIRLLDGSPAELLSNEHLLYIAQVMSDKMKAIAQRVHVTYPRSMGVWALGNVVYIASSMQWPDTFDGISAELMYIGIKRDNMNTLRQDTDFYSSLGYRAIEMSSSSGFP